MHEPDHTSTTTESVTESVSQSATCHRQWWYLCGWNLGSCKVRARPRPREGVRVLTSRWTLLGPRTTEICILYIGKKAGILVI